MRLNAGRSILLCITLLCATAAQAEERKGGEGYESYSLGEVYITGEKPPVSKEASITNEITAEEMKATNSRTVAEALAHVPGMAVTTGRKNQPNVTIHGFFDQSRILVMIDGVPYYETKAGFLDLNQFSTDNVARIEVTKGAASVLYGANAEGGIINIITRQPVEKPYFEVNVEGGDVDYFKTSASHGMKKGIFSYWLNYEHSQAHGWRMSDDFTPVVGTVFNKPGTSVKGVFEDGGTRNQSDYSKDSFWAKFGIEPSKGSEYYVNLSYISRDYGMPPSTSSVNVFTTRPHFSNFFRYNRYDDWGIDLSGQQKIGDRVTLKGKVFYHNHVDGLQSYPDQSFTNPFAYSNYYDYMIGGSLIARDRDVLLEHPASCLQLPGRFPPAAGRQLPPLRELLLLDRFRGHRGRDDPGEKLFGRRGGQLRLVQGYSREQKQHRQKWKSHQPDPPGRRARQRQLQPHDRRHLCLSGFNETVCLGRPQNPLPDPPAIL